MEYALEPQPITIGSTTIKLFVPKEASVRKVYREQKEANGTTPFPFWAKVWPSALALSQFIQTHPEYVAGKKVLELAAGLGLPSFLSALYARSVCCSDYLPEVLEVVNKSIELNGIANITTRLLNWHHLPGDLAPDVLLLSDINYDPEEFEILYRVLAGFLKKGVVILLSTPQRLMAKPFIERLLPWCVQQEEVPVSHSGEGTFITVLVLSKAPGPFTLLSE